TLRDSIQAVKQTSQVGTLGPSSRNLNPSELRESYRSFARSMLDRYEESPPDPEVLADGQELQKAIQNSGDDYLAARFKDLRRRANEGDGSSEDPSAINQNSETDSSQ